MSKRKKNKSKPNPQKRPQKKKPLLEVKDLKIRYPIWGGVLRHKVGEIRAVDGVSFTLHEGETLGLVGESGCGKTTIAKAISNILKPTVPSIVEEGEIIFHSSAGPVNLLEMNNRQMRPYRGEIQMIFQDPFSSLNPRMTVREIIERPIVIHKQSTKTERRDMVDELLGKVGLQPEYAQRYPHEFSGGQRQRIGIARALAVRPKLIVADEPVSALDVSVQSQVINLMQDLQDEFKLTYLFVAHDLSVVYHISDRIAVMYLGDMVEISDSESVYRNPMHPYTKALLSAVPHPDPSGDRTDRTQLIGEIPSPSNKPKGCSFHPRCPIAKEECSSDVPQLHEASAGHFAACPFVDLDETSEVSETSEV